MVLYGNVAYLNMIKEGGRTNFLHVWVASILGWEDVDSISVVLNTELQLFEEPEESSHLRVHGSADIISWNSFIYCLVNNVGGLSVSLQSTFIKFTWALIHNILLWAGLLMLSWPNCWKIFSGHLIPVRSSFLLRRSLSWGNDFRAWRTWWSVEKHLNTPKVISGLKNPSVDTTLLPDNNVTAAVK